MKIADAALACDLNFQLGQIDEHIARASGEQKETVGVTFGDSCGEATGEWIEKVQVLYVQMLQANRQAIVDQLSGLEIDMKIPENGNAVPA